MQEDARPCNTCGTRILARCFDIHSRACASKQARNAKKSAIRSNPMDLIPCAECGEMVDFNVYSIHMEECVGRQLTKCHKCKLLYPTFLFEEHIAVCNVFREEEPSHKTKDLLLDIIDDEPEEGDEALQQMIRTLAKHNSSHNDEPLKLDIINKMKRVTVAKQEECSICYCEIARGSSVIRLTCPHKYHLRCLSAWLQKNPHCPMCRRHVLQ